MIGCGDTYIYRPPVRPVVLPRQLTQGGASGAELPLGGLARCSNAFWYAAMFLTTDCWHVQSVSLTLMWSIKRERPHMLHVLIEAEARGTIWFPGDGA
jgi:hypothetical protein